MESVDLPVAEKIMQAMARAYPDRVDLSLLSMVLGCEPESLQAATESLVSAGLAVSEPAGDDAGGTLLISDKGMAVACGLASDDVDAARWLDRREAEALRQLLGQRIGASHLPLQQADELRSALQRVSDSALVDAAKVWAHQTVGDWRALMRVMQTQGAEANASTSHSVIARS